MLRDNSLAGTSRQPLIGTPSTSPYSDSAATTVGRRSPTTPGVTLHRDRPRCDPQWWVNGAHDGVRLYDALRERDVTVVFRFLATRGWSRAAIAAATGLSENRVRAIVQGRQVVQSYDVLERIAEGLRIDRGLMGLAYTLRP